MTINPVPIDRSRRLVNDRQGIDDRRMIGGIACSRTCPPGNGHPGTRA